QLLGVAEWQDMLDPLAGHPRLHQARRAGGAKDFAMRGDVIGMGMRNKGPCHRKMGIKPPPDLGQPDTGAKFNLPGHEGLSFAGWARSSSGRWGLPGRRRQMWARAGSAGTTRGRIFPALPRRATRRGPGCRGGYLTSEP